MFEKRYFVLCPSFHGATLLAKLLHAHPRIVALGDTFPKKDTRQRCGCGRLVDECRFWQTVNAAVTVQPHPEDLYRYRHYPRLGRSFSDRLTYLYANHERLRRLVPVAGQKEFVRQYRQFLAGVYRAQPGSPRVFIDGVKSISRLHAFLAFEPEMVDGIIHLVRDPGDYARSRAKKKPGVWNFADTLVRWRLYHSQVSRLRSNVDYMRVFYRDLAEKPQAQLNEIFAYIGVEKHTLDALYTNFEQPWHFFGNRSLRNFSGIHGSSRHDLSLFERVLTGLVTAGAHKNKQVR